MGYGYARDFETMCVVCRVFPENFVGVAAGTALVHGHRTGSLASRRVRPRESAHLCACCAALVQYSNPIMSSAEEDSSAAAAEGVGAAGSGGAVLDGDIMQTLASGDLPQQLAGMTSALQEQLLSITQEMNKLKGELYSEQGGLAAKLNDLAERAALETGGDGDKSRPGSDGGPRTSRAPASAAARGALGGEGTACCNRRAGADGSSSGPATSSSACSRAGLAAAEGHDSYGRAGSSERRPGGRHVDWAPGTRDLNREQKERRRQQVHRKLECSHTDTAARAIGPLSLSLSLSLS